jgi:hypothetical protein
MHKRKIIAASVFLAPFALAAIFLFPESRNPKVSPSQVFTWDCEYPAQKPVAITLTCADGGMYLDQIDWSRWDESGARGTGTYSVNNCDPNCSEGTFLRASVNIQLKGLTQYRDKYFLRTLVIRSADGENLPGISMNLYEWDVMEFGQQMEEATKIAGSELQSEHHFPSLYFKETRA